MIPLDESEVVCLADADADDDVRCGGGGGGLLLDWNRPPNGCVFD